MSGDAQATWSLTLDSSGLRAGAQSAMSSLDRLRMRIQQQTKALAGIRSAMANLRSAQSVQRFEAIPKELERAQAEAKKLESSLAKVRDKQAANEAKGFMDIGLKKEAASLEKQLGGVARKIKQLEGEREKLKGDETVKAYMDHGKAAKELEAELAELQTAYARAGGDASKLSEKVAEPVGGMKRLLEQAKAAGGPIGDFASKLESLGGAAKIAGPLALLAVIIAITAAAIKGAYALAKMALISADMARNAARARSNAAFGSAGTKEIEGAMKALREQTTLSKGEAQGLAIELYRAGERGKNLEDAAVTIERFGQLGEDAKGAIKSLYDEMRKPAPMIGGVASNSMTISRDALPRDVYLELAKTLGYDAQKAFQGGFIREDKGRIRQALSRIGQQKFAGSALEQMRSLDKLAERLQENLQSLFEQLKVGVLLGALQKIVGLLDETSESGKAIRETLGKLAQPVADAIEAALPYVEAFFEGLILGGLLVTLGLIKVKNALSGLIPDSITKNIDWLNVAFHVASGTVIALAVAFGLLAAAGFILALPFLTIIGLVVLLVVALVMAVDAIAGWFDEVSAAFEGFDFADIVQAITDGIIGAIEDAAPEVWAAFTNMAEGAYKAFKRAIKSNSPSVLFRLAGHTIPEGLILGVEDKEDDVNNTMSNMVSTDAVEGAGNGNGRGSNSTRGGLTLVMQAGAVVINGVAGAAELTDEFIARIFRRGLAMAAAEGGLTVEVPS